MSTTTNHPDVRPPPVESDRRSEVAPSPATTGLKHEIEQTATEAREQGRSLARSAAEAATEKTRQSYRQGRDRLRDQLGGVASALHTAAAELESGENNAAGPLFERAANQVEQINEAVGEREFGDLLGEGEKFARTRPAVFLGVAFGVGVFLGRFLTSSARYSALADEQD